MVSIYAGACTAAAGASPVFAQGGEADSETPRLGQAVFLGGVAGPTLLNDRPGRLRPRFLFGLGMYSQLKNLPVHKSMLEISELIYETCKTYLLTQGKFLMILEVFIGAIMSLYFGVLQHMDGLRSSSSWCSASSGSGQLWRRLVRHPGEHVRQFAHGVRQPEAASRIPATPFRCKAGMSIGMLLISVELLIMLCILLFVPGDYAGPCFIGFAIGESLGAAALRVAGGIFTKIADIGADLMKIVFNIKEDDARNPGVIADCTGDNAGDSVGPTADGFETYGVTGVALITFILLAVTNPTSQVNCWCGSSSCAS